jgi:ribosomal protein L18
LTVFYQEAASFSVGQNLAKKAVGKQIQTVVFDRKPSISWKSSKVAEGKRTGLNF